MRRSKSAITLAILLVSVMAVWVFTLTHSYLLVFPLTKKTLVRFSVNGGAVFVSGDQFRTGVEFSSDIVSSRVKRLEPGYDFRWFPEKFIPDYRSRAEPFVTHRMLMVPLPFLVVLISVVLIPGQFLAWRRRKTEEAGSHD